MFKSRFSKMFDRLLKVEGGYVNDEYDRGGETKYGISKASYPYEDIENITIERAKHLYKRDFYHKYNIHKIKHFELAYDVFDTAVLHGGKTAIKMLQESLNLINNNGKLFNDLVIDGVIGKNTLWAIKKANKDFLLVVFNGLQFTRFVTITKNNPELEKFFRGWVNKRVLNA